MDTNLLSGTAHPNLERNNFSTVCQSCALPWEPERSKQNAYMGTTGVLSGPEAIVSTFLNVQSTALFLRIRIGLILSSVESLQRGTHSQSHVHDDHSRCHKSTQWWSVILFFSLENLAQLFMHHMSWKALVYGKLIKY